MIYQVSPEDFQRALAAARLLHQQLLPRVLGRKVPASRCSCGACESGPATVTGLRIPAEYPWQTGVFTIWSCETTGDDGHPAGLEELSQFISWAEIFPLFRNAFAGISVSVLHPYAKEYVDGRSGAPRAFVESGRLVTVMSGERVLLRPVGDLKNAVWVDAELTVGEPLKKTPSLGVFVGLHLDSYAFDPDRPRYGRYISPGETQGKSTFYTRIPRCGDQAERFLPIARIVDVVAATDGVESSTVTFHLDQFVEVLQS